MRAIPFPEMYRPLVPNASEAELVEAYLERLRGAIRSLEDDGVGFAGLIVCSIFANEGLPDVPRGFMPRAAEMVRAAGGFVIADEVQAGYCRTGRWWGYEVHRFTPDIVVTGKPMGNGLPLAATAASKALVDSFRARTRYFNTFASSPLAGGGRHGGARRHRARRSARERRHGRRRLKAALLRTQEDAAPQSATCAATVCSSASRW